MTFLTGALIGLTLTLVIALAKAWVNKGKDVYTRDIATPMLRLVVEAVLVAVFVLIMVGLAFVGSKAAWTAFFGYSVVRGIALLVEYARYKTGR